MLLRVKPNSFISHKTSPSFIKVLPERDVVRDDPQQVNHVHALLDEVPLERGRHEPDYQWNEIVLSQIL